MEGALSCKKRKRDAVSPSRHLSFQDLPDELLAEVLAWAGGFHQDQLTPPDEITTHPMDLALVCRRWSPIVFSTVTTNSINALSPPALKRARTLGLITQNHLVEFWRDVWLPSRASDDVLTPLSYHDSSLWFAEKFVLWACKQCEKLPAEPVNLAGFLTDVVDNYIEYNPDQTWYGKWSHVFAGPDVHDLLPPLLRMLRNKHTFHMFLTASCSWLYAVTAFGDVELLADMLDGVVNGVEEEGGGSKGMMDAMMQEGTGWALCMGRLDMMKLWFTKVPPDRGTPEGIHQVRSYFNMALECRSAPVVEWIMDAFPECVWGSPNDPGSPPSPARGQLIAFVGRILQKQCPQRWSLRHGWRGPCRRRGDAAAVGCMQILWDGYKKAVGEQRQQKQHFRWSRGLVLLCFSRANVAALEWMLSTDDRSKEEFAEMFQSTIPGPPPQPPDEGSLPCRTLNPLGDYYCTPLVDEVKRRFQKKWCLEADQLELYGRLRSIGSDQWAVNMMRWLQFTIHLVTNERDSDLVNTLDTQF